MADRPVLIVLVLVVAVTTAVAGAWWRASSKRPGDNPAELPSEIGQLRAEGKRTRVVFDRALAAHYGLSDRLRGLGDAAREHAAALRALHEAGVAPRGMKAAEGWEPPIELHSDTPRPGATEPWQALDRDFQGLLAALDDSDASFAQHAAALDRLATATHRLSETLATATNADLATSCSFCGKPRAQLRRLIAGPDVYVCDECVALCVEVLEEEIGENWREEAEQRLRGNPSDEE